METSAIEYNRVLAVLINQPLTILCGAGISYNSGLPVVYQFTEAIFDEFDLSQDERRVFHASIYPFEAFIEILEDESDIRPLSEIFRHGNINTNHLLIAQLVKAGRVRNIVTTNFDLLIEQALIAVGFRRNQDFNVYKSESDFGEIDWDKNIINVIKIHGCASDFENMAINMRMVAGQENCANKVNVVQQLFNKKINPVVLILGYSCSDIFDISPIIETITDDHSEVILLEHTNNDTPWTEPLASKSDKNPFITFAGSTRVFVHADAFVKEIWKINALDTYKFLTPPPPSWRLNIERWYSASVMNNSSSFVHQICGRLFYNICCYDLSIKHYEKAISIAFGTNDYLRIGSELGNLGMVYNKLDRYDEALKCLTTSIEFCRRLENMQGQISQLQAIGNTYRNLGRYLDATEVMLEAISLIRKHGEQYDLCTTLGNIALIYNLTQQYQSTISTAEEAIAISRRLGIKNSEGSLLSSLGIAYFSTGDRLKGIAYLRQSLYVNRQIGHEINTCNALCNLAKLLKFDHRCYDEASGLLSEALELAHKLKIRQTEGLVWFLMGEISLAKEQRSTAKAEMLQALQIFSSIFEPDHPFVVAAVEALNCINLP